MIKNERNLNCSYIIFEEDEDAADTLAVAMLRNNPIEGLLCPEISKNNAKTRFAYEISKYQSMVRLFEKTQIGSKQIIAILNTICKLSEELERYLLESDHIVLDPEYIYWDSESEKVSFCYDPFDRFDLKNGLKDLSLWILQKIDIADLSAMKASYTLFRTVSEEYFSLDDTLTKIRQQESVYSFVTDKAIVADAQILSDEKESGLKKEASAITQPIQKGIAKLFEEEEDDWEKEVSQDRLFTALKRKKPKKEKMKKISLKEDAEEKDAAEIPHFDADRFRLSSLNGGIESFEVESFPFLIGSIPYAVDACINDESISRFHARFDQLKGRMYLTDLNSSDGTYLNHVRINGGDRKEIKAGDRIRLGNLEFSVG